MPGRGRAKPAQIPSASRQAPIRVHSAPPCRPLRLPPVSVQTDHDKIAQQSYSPGHNCNNVKDARPGEMLAVIVKLQRKKKDGPPMT